MRRHIFMGVAVASILLGSVGVSYAAFQVPSFISKHDIERKVGSIYTQVQSWSGTIPKEIYLDQYVDVSKLDRLKDITLVWPAPTSVEPVYQASEPPELSRNITLSEMVVAQDAKAPAVSPDAPQWRPDQDLLNVEAVLVPQHVTVISSSQDGKISKVLMQQGDHFKKGDILIEYDCADLEAESDIAGMQKSLTAKKSEGGDKLFKLDVISDVDRLGIQIEDKQAAARVKLYEARMDHCRIRAEFDGHVTNRLANAGEYTRTDRVLMEVASDDPLLAEFLIPSKWLRWVNVGAPVRITVSENEITYQANIIRIYGEVDPASQSIQVVAALDRYEDPLLPGMSGQAQIKASDIEKAGVKGYLRR